MGEEARRRVEETLLHGHLMLWVYDRDLATKVHRILCVSRSDIIMGVRLRPMGAMDTRPGNLICRLRCMPGTSWTKAGGVIGTNGMLNRNGMVQRPGGSSTVLCTVVFIYFIVVAAWSHSLLFEPFMRHDR